MTTQPSVTDLYARGAFFKQRWGETMSHRHIEAGVAVGKRLAETPSRDLSDLLMKLSELLEWVSEDITDPARALLGSAIADVERLSDRPGPAAAAPTVGPKPPAPPRAGAEPVPGNRLRVATIAVGGLRPDRRGRPIIVDGIVYPSLIAASRSTGRSIYELNRNGTTP